MIRFISRRRPCFGLAACLAFLPAVPAAQTVTIVGTQHLRGLDIPPTQEQYAHTIDALSAFAPTQVCIERMSGERLQIKAADPMRDAMTLSPETHGWPLGTLIIPLGVNMRGRLAVLPADARDQAPASPRGGMNSALRSASV